MSTFMLFGVALAAAFAVGASLRTHFEVEGLRDEVKRLSAQLGAAEMDLSTLAQTSTPAEHVGADVPPPIPIASPGASADAADPRVYVQLVPDQPHDRVILSNRSGVAARSLSLHLEFEDGQTPFLPEFGDTNFPVTVLQQGVPYIVLADFRGRDHGPVPARLEWLDSDGTPRVREFPLRW